MPDQITPSRVHADHNADTVHVTVPTAEGLRSKETTDILTIFYLITRKTHESLITCLPPGWSRLSDKLAVSEAFQRDKLQFAQIFASRRQQPHYRRVAGSEFVLAERVRPSQSSPSLLVKIDHGGSYLAAYVDRSSSEHDPALGRRSPIQVAPDVRFVSQL
ncbi:hypothetical protein J6590_019118 [Homalodisca vitripennis]|nr:hypothetical protein J6590_019118 [Homalodisca vitripennis]